MFFQLQGPPLLFLGPELSKSSKNAFQAIKEK